MAKFDLIESALALQNGMIERFAPLHAEFVDPGSLSWIPQVEAETEMILSELRQILSLNAGLPSMASLSDRQRGMGGTSWQSLVLRMYGNEVPTSSLLAPKTYDLVNSIPEVDTAMFSVLQPGAAIEAHQGPSKAELRYHLPLIVPTSDPEVCGLRVGETTQAWEVGKSVLFDDTVDHEAWNLSNAIRVVLFIGCRRPMPTPMAQIIGALTSVATKRHPDVMEILEKAERDNRRIVAHLMQRAAREEVIDIREPASVEPSA